MNQFVKSTVFVAIAAASAALAFLTRPTPSLAPLEEVGDKLFPTFSDVTRVRALQIVRPNRDKDTVDPLRIERRGGQWIIASHQDYPANAADAKDRIIEAALELQDLTVLNVQSDVAKDHQLYGVMEPSEESLAAAADEQAIGTLIRVEDADGESLAEIIVGKSPEGEPSQRFVRRPGQARVYVCALDPTTLSTRFDDWIEGNLLDLDTNDIRQVVFNDTRVYEARVTGPGGAFLTTPDGDYVTNLIPRPRLDLAVDWHTSEQGWSLVSFVEYRGGQPVDSRLLENEELNAEKLNDMRDALNAIKILDVEEIKGLGGPLKLDTSLVSDLALKLSLRNHGFYVLQQDAGDGGIQLLSKEGGLTVRMNDGIQYTLRFGAPAGLVKDGRESKLNRYLLVTVDKYQDPMPAPSDGPPQQPAEGDNRVKQLSSRFRWYYVISEDVYKKLHLSRFEIIREREGELGFDIEAFRRIEREGLRPPEKKEP